MDHQKIIFLLCFSPVLRIPILGKRAAVFFILLFLMGFFFAVFFLFNVQTCVFLDG